MANSYGGYFLTGLAGGLKSGFQMGQQAQEMKWQKAQRKRLEDQQNKIMESSTIFNNLVSQLGEDGNYSEDDTWKISTAYMALGYEVQERVQGSYKAIQAMDKNRVEQNNEWFGYVAELTSGMNAEDAQSIFDTVRDFVKGEKALERYAAYESILKKKSEVMRTQPEDIWGQAGKLPIDIRPEYLRAKGVEIPEITEPTEALGISDYNSAANYLSKFINASPEAFNKIKAGLERNTGIDLSAITQEALREPEVVTEPKPETVTTLKNWEKMFDIKAEEGPKTEEEYNRALNLLAQSEDRYTPKYATWKEALIAEVKGIAKDLEGITNKEDYDFLMNIYMQKLEEIKTKYPDVDLNQFPEFKKEESWLSKQYESLSKKLRF